MTGNSVGRSQGSAQLINHLDEKWKRRTLIDRYFSELMTNPVIDQFGPLDGCHDHISAIVEATVIDLLIAANTIFS